MNFDETVLAAKLAFLNPTQTSIEALSGWCQFYRSDAPRVVASWARSYDAASSAPPRQLTLLYLANDVLQNSRKKGPDYVNAFLGVLPPRVMALAGSSVDAKTGAAASRLSAIMRERQVFGHATGKVLGDGAPTSVKRPPDGAPPASPPLPRRKRGARSDLVSAQTALAAAAAAAAHAAALESSLDGVLSGGEAPGPSDAGALETLVSALTTEAAARRDAASVLSGLADAEVVAAARVDARREVAARVRAAAGGEGGGNEAAAEEAARGDDPYSPGGSPVA